MISVHEDVGELDGLPLGDTDEGVEDGFTLGFALGLLEGSENTDDGIPLGCDEPHAHDALHV